MSFPLSPHFARPSGDLFSSKPFLRFSVSFSLSPFRIARIAGERGRGLGVCYGTGERETKETKEWSIIARMLTPRGRRRGGQKFRHGETKTSARDGQIAFLP